MKSVVCVILFTCFGIFSYGQSNFLPADEAFKVLGEEIQELYPAQTGPLKIYYNYQFFSKSNLSLSARAFLIETLHSSLESDITADVESVLARIIVDSNAKPLPFSSVHMTAAREYVTEILKN